MPDGSYRYSQTSVAKAIGKVAMSFSQFLASKRPEALPYKGLTFSQVSYEGHHALQFLGSKCLEALPYKEFTPYKVKVA